jgi:uncharacterized protein YcfJ
MNLLAGLIFKEKYMRKILAIAAMVASTMAVAQDATVINVVPMYRTILVSEAVPQIVEVCRDTNRGGGGLIAGATSGIFGSTGGAAGAAIGYLIGNEIGGSGTTRQIARAAGTIVGNSVGNTVSESGSRRSDCEYREMMVTRDVLQQVTDGYLIDVEYLSTRYQVRRGFAPEVGSAIPIVVGNIR